MAGVLEGEAADKQKEERLACRRLLPPPPELAPRHRRGCSPLDLTAVAQPPPPIHPAGLRTCGVRRRWRSSAASINSYIAVGSRASIEDVLYSNSGGTQRVFAPSYSPVANTSAGGRKVPSEV